MASKKPDPYAVDSATAPLTDEEVKTLRPAEAVLKDAGLDVPKRGGRPLGSGNKKLLSIRLDTDIINHFKDTGEGWQTRINDALARVVKEEEKKRA